MQLCAIAWLSISLSNSHLLCRGVESKAGMFVEVVFGREEREGMERERRGAESAKDRGWSDLRLHQSGGGSGGGGGAQGGHPPPDPPIYVPSSLPNSFPLPLPFQSPFHSPLPPPLPLPPSTNPSFPLLALSTPLFMTKLLPSPRRRSPLAAIQLPLHLALSPALATLKLSLHLNSALTPSMEWSGQSDSLSQASTGQRERMQL